MVSVAMSAGMALVMTFKFNIHASLVMQVIFIDILVQIY